ncbi:hypothetical protein RAF13_27070, partial [Klebsiella pneumoniae]
SSSSKAYRIFNRRTLVVEESVHVTFNESNPHKKGHDNDISDLNNLMDDLIIDDQKEEKEDDGKNEPPDELPKDWIFHRSHPKELVLGDIGEGMRIRSS